VLGLGDRVQCFCFFLPYRVLYFGPLWTFPLINIMMRSSPARPRKKVCQIFTIVYP
jgi:hypothetical protein